MKLEAEKSAAWSTGVLLALEESSSALAIAQAGAAAANLSVEIVQIAMDPERGDNGVLCQLRDGRVFVTLGDSIEPYMEMGDETALPAFNRAFRHNPNLFKGPITPRVPQIPAMDGPGLTADLTDRDRERMYQIIRKHHRFYFADHPTKAQMDNLIESLGMRVVEGELKRRVDKGILD